MLYCSHDFHSIIGGGGEPQSPVSLDVGAPGRPVGAPAVAGLDTV